MDLDPVSHTDKDVSQYTQYMSQGKKLIDIDESIVKKREEAQKDIENPYFLATDENDQNAV